MASVAALSQGTWIQDLSRDENIEEYFKTIGLNKPLRILAKKIKTTLKIGFDEVSDEWNVTRSSKVETKTSKFKMGETFTEKTYDGRDATIKWTLDGTKWIGTNHGFCKHPIHVVWEFIDDVMAQTLTVNGVTAKNYFKKEK